MWCPVSRGLLSQETRSAPSGLIGTQAEIRRRPDGIFPRIDSPGADLPDADAAWDDGHAPGIIALRMPPRLNSWTLATRMLENHGSRGQALSVARAARRDSDLIFAKHITRRDRATGGRPPDGSPQ